MRLLHSADWQIGLRARHVAAVGERVRAARLEAARRVVAAAGEHRVDALVLAGDVFDDNYVDEELLEAVLGILAACEAPVYLLPGNHDALTPDSVYHRPAFAARASHVHLLASTEPVRVEGAALTLLPAPVTRKHSVLDPTEELAPAPDDGTVVVGVAHGSLAIEGKHSPDAAPIEPDAARRAGLDYLALGDWHSTYIHDERTAYSGAHEPTKFGEDGAGQALWVEVDGRGATPRIEPVPTGVLRWRREEVELTGDGAARLDALEARLTELSDLRDTLLRIRTTGHSSPDVERRLAELAARLEEAALLVHLDRRDLASEVAAGRLAEVAAGSALVAALLEELRDEEAEDDEEARARRRAARGLLTDLVLEVWG